MKNGTKILNLGLISLLGPIDANLVFKPQAPR